MILDDPGRDRRAHLVTPLSSSGQPRRLVIFDTEARSRRRAGHAEQRWALGAAEFVRQGARGARIDARDYTDPGDLWRDVAELARPKQRLVCFAHNLGYDLRISRALELLPALGFALNGIVLEPSASWANFQHPERGAVLCCDLMAWLPTSLAKIAADLGATQPPLDHRAASDAELLARCRADVAVTRQAVLELLGFVTDNDLGPFRPTGAGQGHAAWRRRFLTDDVLVHDNPDALSLERTAMWTGRCEAWRWGKIRDPDGITEFDLRAAYCHLALDPVPVALIGTAQIDNYRAFAGARRRYAVMAECRVTVRDPVVPAAQDETRIHWPVGTFDTVLWDPEIELAWQSGRVEIRRAWVYRKAPALAAMARWVLDHLDDDDLAPLQHRLVKHWSRTLIGRMALRYRRWEKFGERDTPGGCRLSTVVYDDGPPVDRLRAGRDVFDLAELTEADSSTPQITGYVMAAARAQLWRLMRTAGLESVLYLDTDSLIVNAAGAARLYRAIDAGDAPTLQVKATYRHVDIAAPRSLVLAGQRRTAGIPLAAQPTRDKRGRVRPGHFDGEVWQSVKQSLARGELDHVTVAPRHYELANIDARRDHLPDGRTAPHRQPPRRRRARR